jgi:uncharacterized protein (TIGR03437 family)
MTAKWTVLALLAAAPAFSQNTIQLTYDSFDAADSTLNPGLICSPAKVATATNSANGFSFPVNWSCWSGNATVTGLVTVSFSPATVTATQTGTFNTLNFSTPITMTATAVIAGTGITGASLTASTAFPSSKGLLEANPIAGCNQSSITGPGTVTLTCPVSTVQGWNDTVGLMPAFGIALNVVTADRDGTAWGDGVQVYGKFKQCSGNSCPAGTDKIAFVTSQYFPNNSDPIVIGDATTTPHFYAQVLYDLESVPNGQVSLELLGKTTGKPVTLAYGDKTFNVTQGGGTLGADGKLTVGPIVPPVGVNLTGLVLTAILSDATGIELASDTVVYQVSSMTMSLQLGCASGSGSQPGTAAPLTFVADTATPPKVFYRFNGDQQTCAITGSGFRPAIQVTYTSAAPGFLSTTNVDTIDAPAGENQKVVIYVDLSRVPGNWNGYSGRPAPSFCHYVVQFYRNEGQAADSEAIDIPVEFVAAYPPIPDPVPAGSPVSIPLELNILEPGLNVYRYSDADPTPNLVKISTEDTFTFSPAGQGSMLFHYSLRPSPNGFSAAGGQTFVSFDPATLTIPPVSGSTPATVSTPAVSLSVPKNTAARSVATTKLSQTIDNVKAAATANTGNLPSPQFSVSAAPAADASIAGYIPINSTYSFTPAIPQDGSFSAAITFQYSAADLPDDPNFVEASLQVISYDPATGIVTSYPTVLDTLNKKATAQITGLAPYYSLAVLGPFTKTTVSLPYLAPAAGMSPLTSLVNWGATDTSLQVGSPAVSGTPGTTTLKAGAQLAQGPAQWFGGTDPSLQNSPAWLRVKSDQSTVAAAQLFSGMGLEFAAPLSAPAGTLVFPNVQSDDLFETTFTLINPGTAATAVNLHLRGQDGTNVDSAVINIAGLGSWSGTASGTFTKLKQPFQGYVLVVSPQNLVGYEMLAGPKVVAALPALPLPAAVSGTATLYSPNFTYGGGTGSIMHLSNPTAKDANVTIRLYDNSGNALGQPLTKLLPAGQQATIDVGGILGAAPATAVTGSVVVQSTMPAIVGDLSTGGARSFITDRAALPLVSTLSPNLILPYLANDGSTYTASVAVFNPNTSPAAVKISAFGPNGASAGSASFNVAANGRIAGALSTLVSGASGLSAGYVRIDANVPVVAAGFMNSVAGGDSAAMLALATTGPAPSGTTPAPKFAASASSLDFGSVAVTQVSDKAVTLQNTGTATLNITSITPPASPFTLTAPATPFSIAAGGIQVITVRFAPTAAGSQSGSVKIANNDSTNSNFTLALTGQGTAASTGVKPAFPANGVVNAASYTTPLARCSLASIFGTNLANTTAGAGPLPWPTILGGVQVIIGGVPAPVFVVSPLQINFQVPCEMPLTGSATITVNNGGAVSTSQSVTLAPYAPGVFGYYRVPTSLDPVIVHVDNSLVTPTSPAKAGEILVVYATGVGKLSQLPTTGAASPSSPPAQAVDLPTATVGGAAASVQFAGLTPGSVGLVQINIQLPSTLPAGSSLPLVATFAGAASPPVNLWVQSSATGPVRGTVLVSDSFNRADAAACSLGRADLANGGSGSHYYLPVFPATSPSVYPVALVSKALQNTGLNYSGVQLTASSGCGAARGETIAQDLDIAVDLLVPASSAGVVQAGPYFRARAAAPGDGIVGQAGYWVALTSTGQVMIRGLSPNATIATNATPASFDATRFHTLEMVAQSSSLVVYLDGARLTFTENSASVTTVTLPATTGSNDGTVGIAFGDEANAGKAGGQRAQNLIVAQPGTTP